MGQKKKHFFDWRKHTFSQYVLKVMYRGTRYCGLALQSFDVDQTLSRSTVEGVLFRALEKTCLIPPRHLANFSRCGRTDKGVHSAGNYISVKLRDVCPKPPRTSSPCSTSLMTQDKRNSSASYFVEILNAVLPPDIRILDCLSVNSSFDARFQCLYRVYKYFFFRSENLDIQQMRLASQQFVGKHNFKKFCKIDARRQVNYERTLLWVNFTPVFNDVIWEIEVAGLSFLWQQIRRMVGLLFLIGQHKIAPDTISTLLKPSESPVSSLACIAPQEGLVLYDCFFEGLHFKSSASSDQGLKVFQDIFVKKLQSSIVLGCLTHQLKLFHPPLGYHANQREDGQSSSLGVKEKESAQGVFFGFTEK